MNRDRFSPRNNLNDWNGWNAFTHSFTVIDGGLNFKAGAQPLPSAPKPKLLDEVRQAIRSRHYSYMTEKAYVHWIKRYIFFHNKRHPSEIGEAKIAHF